MYGAGIPWHVSRSYLSRRPVRDNHWDSSRSPVHAASCTNLVRQMNPDSASTDIVMDQKREANRISKPKKPPSLPKKQKIKWKKNPFLMKGVRNVPGSKQPTQVLKKVSSTELGPCTVGMHLAQKVNVEELPGLLARSIY